MIRLKRNEDIVHLYLMTSLYAGELDKVKMGIAKDCHKRAEDVGGKLEMISLPQLRPLILEIEKCTHSLAILNGITKARVSKRSGSTEWFCCSVEEAKKIYSKARNLILSTGNLEKAREINKDLKGKIRKEAKEKLSVRENEEKIMKKALTSRAKKIEKLLDEGNTPKQMDLDL